MKELALHEISVDVRHGGSVLWRIDLCCRAFPFEFGRQTRAGPIRVGVGFKITQMRDRFVRIDLAQTAQRKIPPFTVAFDPIKRCAPILFVDGGPA